MSETWGNSSATACSEKNALRALDICPRGLHRLILFQGSCGKKRGHSVASLPSCGALAKLQQAWGPQPLFPRIANLGERGSVSWQPSETWGRCYEPVHSCTLCTQTCCSTLSFLEHVLYLILPSQRRKTENSWCSILKYAPLLNGKKKRKKIISRNLCFYIRLNKSSSCFWILKK